MCKALLELQNLDVTLDELSAQAGALPYKAKVAAIAQRIAEGESLVARIEKGILDSDAQLVQMDATIERLRKKIDGEQRKLDAGEIDYRQIEPIVDDIASHSKRIETVESDQLKLIEASESAQIRREDYRRKITELEGAKAQMLEAYKRQMAIVAAKTVQATGLRDKIRGTIDEEVLAEYDNLRIHKGGIVVGTFDGVRCSACSLALPTAFAADVSKVGEKGICSECRRILVCIREVDHE
jgi:predicted  nucleic acid-binding Zn-ribbon protein